MRHFIYGIVLVLLVTAGYAVTSVGEEGDDRVAVRVAGERIEQPLLVVPLVLHPVRESEFISTRRSDRDVRAVLERAGQIWAAAGITFDVAVEPVALTHVQRSGVTRGDLRSLAAFSSDDRALHVFFVGVLRANGVASAPATALVADRTTVDDFRATAHEIGHLLGLRHTPVSPDRLMFQGTNGTGLREEEIAVARAEVLRRFPQ